MAGRGSGVDRTGAGAGGGEQESEDSSEAEDVERDGGGGRDDRSIREFGGSLDDQGGHARRRSSNSGDSGRYICKRCHTVYT